MSKFKFLVANTLICFLSISIIAQQNSDIRSDPANLTAKEWREDIRHMARNLERVHKNLFHTISRHDFENAVQKLEDRIPDLAYHEIVVELMRIVAMVGDGHTGLRVDKLLSKSGIYPIRFYLYDDGLFVQRAAAEYKDVVGGRVVKIGNVSALKALNAMRQIVWRDNEMGVKRFAPILLSSPQILHALRLSDSLKKVSITVLKDGEEKTVEAMPTGQLRQLTTLSKNWIDARDTKAQPPLWLKHPRERFWFKYIKETKILYVQYNAVQDKKDETVETFFNRVFEWAEKNPVEKLVLDIRLNGGGNNSLNIPLILGAIKSRLNRRGKFFVIIGRKTFSAAQNAVNELEKYTNVIFIGEPTGSGPNHFGEGRSIVLPNSKLTIRASTLWWQDVDPRDGRKWTAPDIAAELTSVDYNERRDPAMDAIINYKPGMTFADLVAKARASRNMSDFVKTFRAFQRNPNNKYADTQSRMNRFGYELIRARRLDDAIKIFELNVETYPQSANVYDSLAEAHLTNGNRQMAIKIYQKALKIDPNYQSARAALKRLVRDQ